ncbi:maltase 1-like [Planococcus citri]|uniref:maltase 1-like n=1 Tax=Planococcus citri TaxID=170843 RepID=UPI0031F7546D
MKVLLLVAFCLFHTISGTIDRTWWRNTTLYQVLLPSFMDGNGDGFGDLKGLISKLDHFVDLGIETVLITPHYPSPNMNNAGYDITNYTDVNRLSGTMQDFDDLMREMKKRGLKLIIDMVINHSGDQHPWFINSVNRVEPYTDYYVWKDAKGFDINRNPIPPNNWQALYGGSIWKWNTKRQQFYLHQFIEQMPDLNLRNNLVLDEFKKIFEFWANKGVAGFRLDAAEHFVEDDQLRNEPFINLSTQILRGRNDLSNIFTQFLWESVEVIHEFRTFIDSLTEKIGDFERILIPETHSQRKELYEYYGSKNHNIAHFPFNFWLTYTNRYENAYYYKNLIEGYLNCLPEGAVANWNSENHDIPRRAEVFNEEYEFILTSMVLLLPGISFTYYGQELGLAGWHFPGREQTMEAFRLPMQWDDTTNAGFSNNSRPYLPVSLNYNQINVKKQKADENSHYNKVKKMISLRKTNVFKYGEFKSYAVSHWVYSFTRKWENELYVMIFNLGDGTEFVDLHQSIGNLPNVMVIELASRNSDYKTGNEIQINQKLKLQPHVALVLHPKKN